MKAQQSYFTVMMALILSFATGHAVPVVVSGGSENDYESWIIRLSDTRLMVVFCRNPDWVSGDLYVTFSTDDGSTWDPVAPIIQETGDQATLTFVQLPGDTLRLWYASNETGEYGIYTAYSLDGLSWIRQGRINLGWTPTDRFYDPTVIFETDSSLTMSYRGPSGAYIAHCPHSGTWDTLKTMVGASGYRPRLMKHTNGTYLYTYHRNIGGGDYEVFTRTSTDRISWTSEIRLTYDLNSHDPFANETPDGAYMVYYATYAAPAYNLYRRKSYNTIDWENEEQVTSDMTNNTQPHFFFEGNNTYCVWAHAVSYPYDHDVYFEQTPYLGAKEYKADIPQHSSSISVTPNPCRKHVSLTMVGSSIEKPYWIRLYDISGRLVNQHAPVLNDAMQEITIDMGTVREGTYFIEVRSAKTTHLTKVVKID